MKYNNRNKVYHANQQEINKSQLN